MSRLLLRLKSHRLTGEQIFFASGFVVNAGNYLYNLVLGQSLGPIMFADAALMITLLLVFSFVAMTFQIVVAKYSIELTSGVKKAFIVWAYRWAIGLGILIGLAFIFLSKPLQLLFSTQHHFGFILFGLSIPLYFAMSINRGQWQGEGDFVALSKTYQAEMISRCLVTFGMLWIFNLDALTAVSLGILSSVVIGMFPMNKNVNQKKQSLSPQFKQKIGFFFAVSAAYELIQIACNNSDILLVKHYFESQEAGLYASLALIGRVVYFVTWMFIMLLLPKVIRAKKSNGNTRTILVKYLFQVGVIASIITLWCFVYDTFTIRLLFGKEYVSMAPLLGWYALATSLFAMANLFVYYYLSIRNFFPVVLALVFGCLQIVGIVYFHDSFQQVLFAQIFAMGGMFIVMLCYFFVIEKIANLQKNSFGLH